MSEGEHVVSFSLELNIKEAENELRKLQTVVTRSLSLISRATGSEDLREAIRYAQQAIMMFNQLRITMIALQAASGPLGWALAGVSVITSLMATGDYFGGMAYDMQRGY